MKSYKGWYKILNPEKFVLPIDEYMKSYKDQHVNFKSKLELKAIKYCDFNKHIIKWSIEPWAIKYIKPTDGNWHRYYIDLFIEFSNNKKFLVEIKPFSETKQPKQPTKQTQKSILNYQNALITYSINQAKWEAAEQFANSHNMKFIILTEKELN